jgi:hypothetical protein
LKHLFLGVFIAFGQLLTGALAVVAVAATISAAIEGSEPFPVFGATVAAVFALGFGFFYWLVPGRNGGQIWLPGIPLMTAMVAFWTVVLVRSGV